jgi:hypothetical protein
VPDHDVEHECSQGQVEPEYHHGDTLRRQVGSRDRVVGEGEERWEQVGRRDRRGKGEERDE